MVCEHCIVRAYFSVDRLEGNTTLGEEYLKSVINQTWSKWLLCNQRKSKCEVWYLNQCENRRFVSLPANIEYNDLIQTNTSTPPVGWGVEECGPSVLVLVQLQKLSWVVLINVWNLKRAGNLTQETNCLCLIIRVTGIHSLSPITAKCEVFILVQQNLTLILLL